MIDRRRAIGLAAAVLPAWWLLRPYAARSEQGKAFQRLFPFLIDLPGWKGNKPDGLALEMPGNNMVTATRQYERGGSRLTAQVLTGPSAEGALAATKTAMKIETGDARLSTSTIGGFAVTRTFTVSSKTGVVLVALSPSALFSLSFIKVNDDEGLSLAQKFDWKAIQAALK